MWNMRGQWKTREFGKYLCEIFGRGLEWEFLPHPDLAGEYRLAMLEGERYLFLNAFGDGIRFGMLIVAKSLLTNNAALFIEEIESNQHPASLKKLIHFLLDIAKKNSLQIFVTTHNTQVWRDFAYFYKSPRERTSNLQCYHVLRDNNGAVDCRKIDMSTPDQLNVDRDIFEL
jgi:predicted ATPase